MRVKIKPVEGRTIRDPLHGRVVPDDGAEVVRSAYWNRLRRDGDIVFVDFDSAPEGEE